MKTENAKLLNGVLNTLQSIASPVIYPTSKNPPAIPWDSTVALIDGAIEITGMSEACGGGYDLIVTIPLSVFNENFGIEFQPYESKDNAIVSRLSGILLPTFTK